MSIVNKINVSGTEYDIRDNRVRFEDGADFDYGTLVQGGINNTNGYTTGAHLRRSETYWPVIEGPVNVVMQNGLTGYIRLYDSSRTMIDPGEGMPGSDTTNHVLIIAKNATMTLTMKEYNPNTAYFRFYFSCGSEEYVSALVRENARIVPLQTVVTLDDLQDVAGDVTALDEDVSDLKSQITSTTDTNIAYWGEYPFETREKGSGASVVTLRRTLGAITADGTPTYNWFNKLNGEMMRTTATATVDAWEGIHLSAGHTYAIEMILVSGDTSRSENGDMVPSTSVYKEGTHSSVGTLSRPNRDTFVRTFTAEEGIAYNIVLYCPRNASFNNATFTINLKDITIDLPTLEKIDNLVATGTYKSYGRKPLFESSCDVTSQKITIPYDGISSATSQGMAYYGGYVFIAQKGIKNGASSQVPYLHILSFDGTTLTFVRSIPLPVGSLSPADIEFHGNCLSFANSPASGQTYPLLYTTMMWNSTTYNGRNECFVYQLSDDLTSATLVQQIYYQGDQTEDIVAYSSDFLIDERGYLWMLGNTDIMTETGSYGRFLKQLMIPDPSEPLVVLSKTDVIKEYMLNDVLYSSIGLATYQGGAIKNGLLVAPTSGTGAAMVVIDVDTGELVNYTPITFTSKEIEDVFILNGKAYYNTADNYFFTQTFLN